MVRLVVRMIWCLFQWMMIKLLKKMVRMFMVERMLFIVNGFEILDMVRKQVLQVMMNMELEVVCKRIVLMVRLVCFLLMGFLNMFMMLMLLLSFFFLLMVVLILVFLVLILVLIGCNYWRVLIFCLQLFWRMSQWGDFGMKKRVMVMMIGMMQIMLRGIKQVDLLGCLVVVQLMMVLIRVFCLVFCQFLF